MNNIAFVLVAALSFAAFGCKRKGADCAGAISNSMEVSKADMAKMPGMGEKTMAKMKDVGLQHCKDDKWSDDALKCMAEAREDESRRHGDDEAIGRWRRRRWFR